MGYFMFGVDQISRKMQELLTCCVFGHLSFPFDVSFVSRLLKLGIFTYGKSLNADVHGSLRGYEIKIPVTMAISSLL